MIEPLTVVIIVIVIIVLMILALGVLGVVKLLEKKDDVKEGMNCKLTGDWMWNDQCTGFVPVNNPNTPDGTDPNVPDASNLSMNIISFKKNGSIAPPFYLPSWYRFQYINVETGAYGKYSKWSPVVQSVGDNCSANYLEIGIPSNSMPTKLFSAVGNDAVIYAANVYRYSGNDVNTALTPDDNIDPSSTSLVGYLVQNGNNYEIIDTKGPCFTTSCPKPTVCQ